MLPLIETGVTGTARILGGETRATEGELDPVPSKGLFFPELCLLPTSSVLLEKHKGDQSWLGPWPVPTETWDLSSTAGWYYTGREQVTH